MPTTATWPIRRARHGAKILAAAALAATMTVSACGSSSGAKAAGSGASAGPLAGKTVAFSPYSLQGEFFVGLDKQLRTAVEAAGGKYITVDPGNDPAKQLQQIQGLVQRKQINGLILLPLNPPALKPVIEQMVSNKIAGSFSNAPADFGLTSPPPGIAFTYTSWAGYGRMAGEQVGQCITKRLGGKAQVAILGGPAIPGPVVTDRINAMKTAITSTAPGAKIVAEADGQSQKLVSAQKMAAILQAHPAVNAVSGTSDDSVLGAVQALLQAGKDPRKMCIVGLDGTTAGLAAVQDGQFYATVMVNTTDFVKRTTTWLSRPTASPGTVTEMKIEVVNKTGTGG
jgi:ribose transport system substrate-binding protein